jgi:hypothetical protein
MRRRTLLQVIGPAIALAVLAVGRPARASTAVAVPASACSETADSAPAIQAFLATVPNGSTVTFPAGARCMVATSLDLGIAPTGQPQRADTVYDLNGATIFRTTEPAACDKPGCNAPLVDLQGVQRVSLRDGTIQGGVAPPADGPPAYNPAIEHDHGIAVHGDTGVTLTGLTIRDTGGDCVDVDEDSTTHAPSTDITIAGSATAPFTCAQGARQGISANDVDGLSITGVTFELISHSGVDLEPHKNGYIKSVEIRACRFGWVGGYAISGHGSGEVWSDVTIAGNVQTDPSHPGLGFLRAGNKFVRGPITVTGNTIAASAQVTNTSGTGSGNIVATGAEVSCLFELDDSGRFHVTGNTVPTGAKQSCIVIHVVAASRSPWVLGGLAAAATVAVLAFVLVLRGRRRKRRRIGR